MARSILESFKNSSKSQGTAHNSPDDSPDNEELNSIGESSSFGLANSKEHLSRESGNFTAEFSRFCGL